MLIRPGDRPRSLDEPGLRWWNGGRFTVGWKGHLYLSGQPAGVPSVERLAEQLASRPLSAVAKELCGIYGVFVFDSAQGTWQVAVDNAGLYKVFHDPSHAATSFLELLAARGSGAGDLDRGAVLEYLSHGAVYGPGTVVEGVRKLRYDEVLEHAPGATEWRLARKDLAYPSDDSTETVLARFHELGSSYHGLALSADCTGGFDTRLIIAMLQHDGLPFELAVSGSPGSHDVVISRQAAALLRRKLEITPHDISRLEQDLPDAFEAGDGMTDVRRIHRDRQYALARLQRGIQAIAHGGGGAHFKDYFAYQDFPFYGSPKVNFERYYRMRISPVRLPPEQLTPYALELQAQIRARTLARFMEHKAATNNESYDRATYFVRDPEGYGRTASDYVNLGLDVAMPYLDYRNILVSFRLSPWSRAVNAWHRRIITRYCPELARLPTSEGYTASSELRYMPRNLLGFAAISARRVARKASQRFLGKAMFLQLGAFEADAPGFIDHMRSTSHLADGVAALRKLELLGPGASPAQVRPIHVGRIITMGMLARRLGV